MTTLSTSTVAPQRAVVARPGISLPMLYVGALVLWLVTRGLVLVHQGAWPWMNAFVVAAARGIVVGDWNEAVRPQLPAVMGVPLVLAGADEQQSVAVLYIIASLIQFGALLLLVRALWPARVLEQSLALLIFLLLPYNHSIHHYRDVPVVLASSAIFLLAAHWLGGARHIGIRDILWVSGAMLLGVWSRAEVLTFIAALVLVGLAIGRRRALPLVGLYVAAAAVVTGGLLLAYRFEGVDTVEAAHYQWHTFLDSTPESWLTPECRTDPTENCRERDGLTYFGPAEPASGVLPMVLSHPLLTLAKTAQSAFDNLWITFGANLSTFPGVVLFLLLVLAFAPVRLALATVPPTHWVVALATLAETVLPPLSWAPPHPQYHLQLVLPVIVLVVPVL
ncbi:MAG TPA: hypothetical protein VFG86_15545, partial [Chloroflexota bacterium]|nr:hypothetical protein [Chloroflexota bacterium]